MNRNEPKPLFAEVSGADRNKKCPCGSGRKVKKCHPFAKLAPGSEKPTLATLADVEGEKFAASLPRLPPMHSIGEKPPDPSPAAGIALGGRRVLIVGESPLSFRRGIVEALRASGVEVETEGEILARSRAERLREEFARVRMRPEDFDKKTPDEIVADLDKIAGEIAKSGAGKLEGGE